MNFDALRKLKELVISKLQSEERHQTSMFEKRNVKLGSELIKIKRCTKRFPGVIANDCVDFDVKSGEIHTLLGENGAGKTTLMNVLYGLYAADEGEIYVYGEKVTFNSPTHAIKHGIGMIHQHFMLVNKLTVTENIILGSETTKNLFFLDLEKAERKVAELANKYGLKVDPRAKTWQLSVGEQQRVEILKALYRNANILILDEPTAVLSPQEVAELFKTLRKMTEQGCAIIFISHKLKEVMEISDRITVLRRGKVVASVKPSEVDEKKLASLMVGREVLFEIDKPDVNKGDVVLQVENLEALDDMKLPAVKGVSLTISEGEVLGIAGVSGNGQNELIEVIANLRKASKGKVLVKGKDLINHSPLESIEQGVAYVPEERMSRGLITDFSVSENVILKKHGQKPFSKKGILDLKTISSYAERLVSEYEIKTSGLDVPARNMSGGNIQKLLLSRELDGDPVLLIVSQPTRGLDVKATEYVRSRILKQRKKGTAILLVSEDLDEIMILSDKIAAMYEGKIVGMMPPGEASLEKIGLMITGLADEN